MFTYRVRLLVACALLAISGPLMLDSAAFSQALPNHTCIVTQQGGSSCGWYSAYAICNDGRGLGANCDYCNGTNVILRFCTPFTGQNCLPVGIGTSACGNWVIGGTCVALPVQDPSAPPQFMCTGGVVSSDCTFRPC